MIYTTRNNQTIFDLTINTIKNYNGIYDLILGNPDLQNISNVPAVIGVEFIEPKIIPPSVKGSAPEVSVTSQNYFSINNQTVYDIVLQTYNDLNRTYELIQDSNFSNLQTYPQPTSLFKFNPQLIEDNSLRKYLLSNGIIINTKTNYSLKDALATDDGVGIQTDGGIQITID